MGRERVEPLTGMPPVPAGGQAVAAWRELDRRTQGCLLAGEPGPDPAVAVVAVGYARTMLARTRRRLLLPTLAMVVCAATGLLAADLVSGSPALATPLSAVIYVAVVFPVILAIRLGARRRNVRLLRMENVNASLLWATEVSPPTPPPSPDAAPVPSHVTGGGPVVFRFSSRRLLAGYGIVVLVLALVQVGWLQPEQRAVTVVSDCLLLPAVVLLVYRLVRRVRPWEPPVVLDAAGIALPAQGVRVAWPEIAEIRVSPVRGGGRSTAKRRVAAFLVHDPEGVVSSFHPFARRTARRSLEAYATPIAIPDLLLERSAEDLVAAARTFTSAPVRRFG
jgi:hypothetical protein